MDKSAVWRLLGLVLALASVGTANSQGIAPAAKGASAPAVAARINADVLKGAWIRPDGGYMIGV